MPEREAGQGAPNTQSNGIEVEGLVRQFKNGPKAVDGISLTVEPGEIYGFLGPNGAGKSTTVHMLTTLLPPTAGSARVIAVMSFSGLVPRNPVCTWNCEPLNLYRRPWDISCSLR